MARIKGNGNAFAQMKYKSQGMQLTIDAFKPSLEGLNKPNHWVKWGDTIPLG